MTTTTKTLALSSLVAAALSPLAAQAYYLPFPSLGGITLSDNSAETLINCLPSSAGCTNTLTNIGTADNPVYIDATVEVGDRLHGIFRIDTLEDDFGNQFDLGKNSGYDELTGVFDVTVTSADKGADNQWHYTFGASSAFEEVYGQNVAFAWFTDDKHEYSRGGTYTTEQLEARVTNGTLLWTAGFTGDAFWNATIVSNNVLAFIPYGATQSVGTYDLGLNIIENNSGRQINPVKGIANGDTVYVDQLATGNIYKASSGTPYGIYDDITFSMNVPEPGTLALLGIGLFGMGGRKMLQRRTTV